MIRKLRAGSSVLLAEARAGDDIVNSRYGSTAAMWRYFAASVADAAETAAAASANC